MTVTDLEPLKDSLELPSVLRFVSMLNEHSKCPAHDPSPDELNTAERYWIQSIQVKAFPMEIQYLKYSSQQ